MPEQTAGPVPLPYEDETPGSGSDMLKTLIRLERKVTEVMKTRRWNAQVLVQVLPCRVTSGKSPCFSVPQFPHLKNKEIESYSFKFPLHLTAPGVTNLNFTY